MTGPMARRAHNVRLPTRSRAVPFMDPLEYRGHAFAFKAAMMAPLVKGACV